jgi:signal transduction histidine kinase
MSPWQDSALAEQELVESLSWLIRLRWVAGVGVIASTWLAASPLGLPLHVSALYLLGVGLLGYNGLLLWVWRRLSARNASNVVCQWFARLQIGLDWIAVALLVWFTGGIESPAIFFFLFHITIASLLLPHDRGFLYVTLAPLLVGSMALLEYNGLLPHIPVLEPRRYDDGQYVIGHLAFFTAACYTMAYLSMEVSRRLRRREDELAGLYRSVQATTSTLDLSEVLNQLAEATTRSLRCKGAAIRLLDKTGSHLELAGAFGLSKEYRHKPPIPVAGASIDQEALSGKTVVVDDTAQDERLLHPSEAVAEGIRSILSTPLSGKTGAIGVLHAYGSAPGSFTEDDATFLGAIAAQGAVAIENARSYRLLQDLDKSKSQFVRIVTHELRSPVQVVTSLLNLLERGYTGDLNQKQADLVMRARRRIQVLQTLIDDLLDLAAGKADVLAPTERGPVSLTEVVRAVSARYEGAAQEKGLALYLECPADSLQVWGDRSELDRLLNNLLSNAIKYTPAGQVSVRLEEAEGSARITVADSGIGIPQDAMPQLFQEFFRARNAKALEEKGTGLGLSIVQDLVHRYGGTIDVDSAQGQGTTFTLTLPLARRLAGREASGIEAFRNQA